MDLVSHRTVNTHIPFFIYVIAELFSDGHKKSSKTLQKEYNQMTMSKRNSDDLLQS
jgi:hypothetical protein